MASRHTLAREVSVQGVTLHAGVPSRLRLLPAVAGTGIEFRRADLKGSAPIPALWSNVAETRLGTVLCGPDGSSIGVVEHLMAALAGAEIDDCIAEIEGPEPPLLDGDALSFLVLIDTAGARAHGERHAIRLNRAIEVSSPSASVKLVPAEAPAFSFEIDFPGTVIGRQHFSCAFDRDIFRGEIAPARTFGFLKEAEQLRAAGYGRGADLTNTLVIDGSTLMNPELQRFPDEFVRHKILDAVGDLKLAGLPVIARFEGQKSSHALNNQLLRALFADPANYRVGPA
jgi:UDP-3-O-[3-hydroxymyristoyl] N-acetylglucosamine deacetylase